MHREKYSYDKSLFSARVQEPSLPLWAIRPLKVALASSGAGLTQVQAESPICPSQLSDGGHEATVPMWTLMIYCRGIGGSKFDL